MELESKKVFKTLNPNKVWLPVIIGLAIVVIMFYTDDEMDPSMLPLIFEAKVFAVLLAVIILLARDAGYVYRIRTITGKQLSWGSAIIVIILWEFASAVTPSVVGGTAVAIFILNKEGVSLGKSMAYVMLTAIMDNLFFIVFAPIILITASGGVFEESAQMRSLQYVFYVSYSLIALYTFIMAFGLFMQPRAFKWLLLRVTQLRWLRRWREKASEHGDEIINASRQLRGKGAGYWLKIIFSTIFIWSARYLMLNLLMAAYVDFAVTDHLLIFGRQVVMWIVMLISPTPGSSGTAEYFFKEFFALSLGDYTIAVNIFWRLLTYYFYLLTGAICLSWWLPRVFKKKPSDKKPAV